MFITAVAYSANFIHDSSGAFVFILRILNARYNSYNTFVTLKVYLGIDLTVEDIYT